MIRTIDQNKFALVEAHRNQDWESAKVLSQEKQSLKKYRYCVDCGLRCCGIRCATHAIVHRIGRKLSFAALLLTMAVSTALAAPPDTMTWNFFWMAPTNQPILSSYVPGTNQAYKLYGTATLGLAMTNWPLLAVWTNWTVSGDGKWFSNQFTVASQPYFFLLNPTNTWGETNFAAWVQTGPMLYPQSIGLSAP